MDMAQAQLWSTLGLVLGVVMILLATRLQSGPLISPFSLSLFMVVSIFAVRPLMMMDHGGYDFYGIDVLSGFTLTTQIGFLAIVSISGGYFFRYFLSRNRPAKVGQFGLLQRPAWDVSVTSAFWAAVFLILLWLVIMMVVGGGFGFVVQMFGGRSADLNANSANMPVAVPAIPTAAAIVMAIARIGTERLRALTRRETLLFWIACFLAVVPPSASGSRRFLIPSLVAALLAVMYTRWNKIIPFRAVAVGFVAFLALSIFPFVRSAGSRTGRTDLIGAMLDYFGESGVRGTLDSFFLSYDTEMFNYVAYLSPRLGDSIPYGFFRGTIGDVLLAPIPSALAPMRSWSDELLSLAFGAGCGVGVCPVPSLVGVLFYDLSFPGLIIGLILFGMWIQGFDRALFSANGARLALVVTFGSFVPIIVRGNSVGIAWIAFNIFVMVALVTWLMNFLGRTKSLPDHGRTRTRLANSRKLRLNALRGVHADAVSNAGG
jgi:hypothetical protein